MEHTGGLTNLRPGADDAELVLLIPVGLGPSVSLYLPHEDTGHP